MRNQHAFIAIVDLDANTQQIVELIDEPVTVDGRETVDGYTCQFEDHTLYPLVTFERTCGEWVGLRLREDRWLNGADDPQNVHFRTSESRETIESLIADMIRS
jgi:hypothetical protein